MSLHMNHLVIGGTGTLGSALMAKLTAAGCGVTCLSRDELKQAELRKLYPKAKFYIGDVRDKDSLLDAMTGVQVVWHVAALKQVDTLQMNPVESIKTNILGTMNVAEAAMARAVQNLVFSSTDKAVLPLNVYGMSKGIAEQYLWDVNRRNSWMYCAVYRWGNVVGSRGSAIPYFVRAIQAGEPVNLTHEAMTRFWIRIEDAVDFMLRTYRDPPRSEALIPDMYAAPVTAVLETIAKILGKELKINVVGPRPGEKIHETIFTSHAYCRRSDSAEQFTPDGLRELLKPVVEAEAAHA